MENIFCYWKKCIKKSIFCKTFSALLSSICFWSHFYKTSNPALCWQKEFLYSPTVEHKWRSLSNPFPANHCSAFSYSHSFSSLSILTILLDKQLMKSFVNINILIKVKLFCWKKFVLKKFLFEKRLSFERKKNFLRRKTFFCRKKWFLEKKLVVMEKNFFLKEKLWKKTFEKKLKNFFFYLWRLKVSGPKSPDA